MLKENTNTGATLNDKQRFDNDVKIKTNTKLKSIYISRQLDQKYLKVFEKYYSDFILFSHFRQKYPELLELNVYFSGEKHGEEVMDKIKDLVEIQKCNFHQLRIFNIKDC
jgi:hypothetical protein